MKKLLGSTIAIVVFLLASSSVTAAQKITACDNIGEMLAMYHLENSVKILDCKESSVVAEPVVRADGTRDNSLWEFVQYHHKVTKDWTHDNKLVSALEGHGKESYRQKGRPSMQVKFFAVVDGVPKFFVLDMDRFPPSAKAWVSSVRHFLQEQIPNFFFHKKTNQERMHTSMQKRYGNKLTGSE